MINGSPNDSGNTNKILEIFAKEMDKNPKEESSCTNISLSKMSIEHCRGCRICFDTSELCCPYKDDVASIKTKMEEADIIVIGSPVYVEDVTGLTKTWIDRMTYNCHRPLNDLEGLLLYYICSYIKAL